jgi:hypothetical protein
MGMVATSLASAAEAVTVPKLIPAQPSAPLAVAVDDTVKSVQDLLQAVGPAQTALQSAAASLQDKINNVVSGAPADPGGVPGALVAAVGSSLGQAESVALSEALALAAKATASVCPTLGAAAAETSALAVPTMPDYSRFGPLAAVAKKYDQTAADTLRNYYVSVFAKLLSPVALPDALNPASPYVVAAQAMLKLLQVNWHSTYFPAGGGPSIERDTPGFLHLPSLLDVDGNLGFDVCARFDFDFDTSAINVQIDRIPLADANMRANIRGQLLSGVISPGYEIPEGSRIPSMFESALDLTGTTFTSKVNDPGKSFVQTLNLTSALQYRVESEDTPQSYSLVTSKPGGTTGNGTLTKWASSSPATSFAYAMAVGPLLLGVGAANPAPTSFEYCTSAKGYCSNQPGADPTIATASMHFAANAATDVSQFNALSNKTATACPSRAIQGEAHLRGSKLYFASKISSPGFAWFDTDGMPIEGCLATVSTTATLPSGTKAEDRLVTFAGAGGAPPATAKSGTLDCPPAFALTGGSLGIAFGLARYLCAVAPANTALPVVDGGAYQTSVLTSSTGSWTPAAPNLPSFSFQWLRCDGAGACTSISGATANTYTATSADVGMTLRSVVTATNFDGTASATSAPTATIMDLAIAPGG